VKKPQKTSNRAAAKQESESKSLATESQSVRITALLCAAAELEQIGDNFENWAKKENAKFIYPNAFNLAKVEDWVNTWLSKQRLVAVFFSNPHLCYDKDDFALFITTERKEFHLTIDVFRLHMPAIATSLKELYNEFWEDVGNHIECYKRSKKRQQEDIPPSTLIGESIENVFWVPTLFLEGAVATLIRRLRHIAEIVRQELPAETQPASGHAETEQTAKRIIAAIVISLIVIVLFELLVYRVPIGWLKNHPNSYGLQGGIVLLILSSIFALFKPAWRKWYWKTALLALVVLILSLLGGRSSR
jgi:hypothetical protein